MSDEKDNGRNPGGRPPLTLKPRGAGSVSAGTVKQSFSHGRSKTVVVETKRPRTHAPAAGNLAGPSPAERRGSDSRPAPRGGGDSSGLSAEELRARQNAIERAREQARVAAETKAREDAARAEREAAAKAAEAKAAEAKAAEAAKPAEAAPAPPAPEPAPPAA
ncbi:translation initiation factor IF-2 associated domain-containing protein, partial [Phenylobacterium sp.]|uniref:translation initiation factor IF-2 associated domain-containing protein n=1 Tax=Phenylobacterium sp. TaxID=1871053 RepID=UPI0019B48403